MVQNSGIESAKLTYNPQQPARLQLPLGSISYHERDNAQLNFKLKNALEQKYRPATKHPVTISKMAIPSGNRTSTGLYRVV